MDKSVATELLNSADYDCFNDLEAAGKDYSEKEMCYLFEVSIEQWKMQPERLYLPQKLMQRNSSTRSSK